MSRLFKQTTKKNKHSYSSLSYSGVASEGLFYEVGCVNMKWMNGGTHWLLSLGSLHEARSSVSLHLQDPKKNTSLCQRILYVRTPMNARRHTRTYVNWHKRSVCRDVFCERMIGMLTTSPNLLNRALERNVLNIQQVQPFDSVFMKTLCSVTGLTNYFP